MAPQQLDRERTFWIYLIFVLLVLVVGLAHLFESKDTITILVWIASVLMLLAIIYRMTATVQSIPEYVFAVVSIVLTFLWSSSYQTGTAIWLAMMSLALATSVIVTVKDPLLLSLGCAYFGLWFLLCMRSLL